ncbi:hypothetical protein [Reyranella sp.]|uniref:hypothetical protein n=1 Tax=Reyranella sp. TaxID=1929291 RepID=UPI003BAC9801
MKISARDIDHLTLTPSDPEAVAGRLAQLGFTLTPEGVEPRCVCFQPDRDDIPTYVELLGDEPAPPALAVNVAELDGEPTSHAWETDEGFTIEASVVTGALEGPVPWRPVKHETAEAFMEPEWIVHPNGALGLTAVHVVAAEPKETADALKAAWGATVEEIFDGCLLVRTGAVELLVWSTLAWQLEYKAIEVMAPDELPAIVGITVAVERARPLQALLRANNVPFGLAEGDRVLVAAEQGAGVMIEFLPQT